MEHNAIVELLGAYSLDAVEAEERNIIEAHLPSCPKCRAELAEFRETAGMLAHTGEEAPAQIWDQIAGRLTEEAPPLDINRIAPLDGRRSGVSWLQRNAMSVVAAAAVIAVAILGLTVLNQRSDIRSLENDLASTNAIAKRVAADPASTKVRLAADSGSEHIDAVVNKAGRAYVLDETMAELPDDRTYQMWAIVDGRVPISLGVMGTDVEGCTFVVPPGTKMLALTEEVSTGVITSENAPVVSVAL